MIVEVVGVSTRNKGAELMLVAVAEHLRARGVEVAVEAGFGEYDERARYGLRTKLPRGRFGRSKLSAALMPESLRKSLGLVAEGDVDAVLDASGFAFGDQLGARRTREFVRDIERWKGQGKPVVLLPQAFGPFETPEIRAGFARVLELADAVYARDRVSHEHAAELPGAAGTLRLAPDFTNLVTSALPDGFEPPPRWACVVPNHRMVEKTDAATRARYVPFLADCVRELERLELSVSLLLHDTQVDRTLVEPLCGELGRRVDVVCESDPRLLKGMLGSAEVVVASRFHALVGALSQAVPSIGAGWSHKYELLFEDYDCGEMLLPVDAPPERIRVAVESLVDAAGRRERIAGLRAAGRLQREAVATMWSEVDRLLGLSPEVPVGQVGRVERTAESGRELASALVGGGGDQIA